ncbi:hypothetical protein [Frigoriglobus tundricola]|uniref:Uncharacterized protein n=1 Tax=Frigoriglobus tundricola TaxID=2774151 RepID=A0A6M5YUG0_9BACT|nr:hypothetical protein [Frigoriglobus tundricola]QJW96933.1 hypothetical protein FTUN_4493 [Frigoriglobus tundricola]
MRFRPVSLGEWLVVGLIFGLLVLMALPLSQTYYWVGSTDLEVEFVVTDAAGDEPVPGAILDIDSEGGFYEEREPRSFQIVLGPDGRASHVCRRSMCFGQDGLFTHTYAVHLPWWRFRISAKGFQTFGPTNLDDIEYRRAVRRNGPGKSRLVVPVSLHRNPTGPTGAPAQP